MDYTAHDALGLADLVRRREVSASELVEACIERIERINPRLNAVVSPLYDRARADAAGAIGDGPFAGVPFLLKDLTQTIAGEVTTNGSRFFAGAIADHDSELYRRFRRAGVVVVGKSNTPELGLTPVTESALLGPARSPWDISRTPGGSSGGAAAAVASGMVPMASGGDGGGSIRIPASCCGLFGLKPTRARTPSGPDASERWSGFDIDHVITRSVRDSAAMLDAISGPEVGAPYQVTPPGRPFLSEVGAEPGRLRIGFHHDPAFPATVHPDCVAAVRDAASLCESLGHQLEEVQPEHDRDLITKSYLEVIAANTAAGIASAEKARGRRSAPGEWEDETWLAAMLGRAISGAEALTAIQSLQTESRRLARRFAAYDVILTPTLAQPPLPLGAMKAPPGEARLLKLAARSRIDLVTRLPGALDAAIARTFAFIPFTPVANFTGQPSMSVPLFFSPEGLPIGAMFTARFGDEAVLFRLAAQLEAARPWFTRRPPLFAS